MEAKAEEKVAPNTPAITKGGKKALSIMMLKLFNSSSSVADRATQKASIR